MKSSPNGMEKCPRCWAYFTSGHDHQCPPFMVALVAFNESKQNIIESKDES